MSIYNTNDDIIKMESSKLINVQLKMFNYSTYNPNDELKTIIMI